LGSFPELDAHLKVDPVAAGMVEAERGDGTADVQMRERHDATLVSTERVQAVKGRTTPAQL
jgi:hypothetical protein